MADLPYEPQEHVAAIEEVKLHRGRTIPRGEQIVAEGDSVIAEGERQSELANARIHEQTRRRLDEIYRDVEEIKHRLPYPPTPDVVVAIVDVLVLQLSSLTRCDVRGAAGEAATLIWQFVQQNGSRVTEEEVAAAIRGIPMRDFRELRAYADAVHRVVSERVILPGRSLPYRMEALDRARCILAAAGDCVRGSCSTSTMTATVSVGQPPALASSEVLRDVSHLTTLLLGSSPAFADAMRMQSDALAYSLAAFNKVGDMQRQDALGLAITARAASEELNRR